MLISCLKNNVFFCMAGSIEGIEMVFLKEELECPEEMEPSSNSDHPTSAYAKGIIYILSFSV